MPTPLRNFRLDDETWEELLARAKSEGVTASVLIRRLITQYLAD